MMDEHENYFIPESVDEQIEASLHAEQPISLHAASPETRLFHDLQITYSDNSKEDARSLDRAWMRLISQPKTVLVEDATTVPLSPLIMMDEYADSLLQHTQPSFVATNGKRPQRMPKWLWSRQ